MRRICLLLPLALLGLGCHRRAPAPPTPSPPPARATLVAVGDLMMHHDVKRVAREHARGFHGLWEDVQPLFDEADLVFGNLETPVAPISGCPGQPYAFNAPAELPAALKASGFAVLSMANNHTYDQGTAGLLESLDLLAAQNLAAVGAGRTRASAFEPRYLDRKGIRFAFLSFTELYNSNFNRKAEASWVAGMDRERLLEALRATRTQADVVVVSLHWGNEYELRPTTRQREWAKLIIGAGADLILGHHPHVLQPLEWIEAEGRKGVVLYSLGNFISNQDRTYDARTMAPPAGDNRDGAALVATFRKEGQGAALESLRVEPLWTENNWARFTSGQDPVRRIRVVRARKDGGLLELRRARIESVIKGEVVQALGAGLAKPRITPSTSPQTAASPI